MPSPSPLSPEILDDGTPSSDTQDEDLIIRSLEFWFDSGDVVLQVEKTRFRVHQFMLSRHSNIFRDMFNVPQNKEQNDIEVELIEGCPVVHLFDDAHQVQHILSIFYDNLKVHDWRKPMSVTNISTLLRLGKKYEIDYLVDEALKRLRLDHPSTLANWEKISNVSQYREIDPAEDNDNVDIINLAHEQSVPSILPAAYLRFILSGYELASESYLGVDCPVLNEMTPQANLLDPSLLLRQEARVNCAIGRDSIMRQMHHRFKELRNRSDLLPGRGCTVTDACIAQQAKVLERFPLWEAIYLSDDNINPFAPLSKEAVGGLCPKCTKVIRSKYDETRAQLWKDIPVLFGLAKWEELKDFDM